MDYDACLRVDESREGAPPLIATGCHNGAVVCWRADTGQQVGQTITLRLDDETLRAGVTCVDLCFPLLATVSLPRECMQSLL